MNEEKILYSKPEVIIIGTDKEGLISFLNEITENVDSFEYGMKLQKQDNKYVLVPKD